MASTLLDVSLPLLRFIASRMSPEVPDDATKWRTVLPSDAQNILRLATDPVAKDGKTATHGWPYAVD